MGREWRTTLRRGKVAMVVVLVSACTSWHPHTGPLPEPTPTNLDPLVRLRMTDGRAVLMYNPRLKDDSIVGFDGPATPQPGARIAVRKADVVEVATSRVDALTTASKTLKTVGLLTVAWVVLMVVAFAATSKSGGGL